MNTKPLGATSQKIVVYLYMMKKPCSKGEIVNAVQDSIKSVKNSLDTLTQHELVIRVQRGYYVINPNTVIRSELDGAVIGLRDTNLYGKLYGIRLLSEYTIYSIDRDIVCTPVSYTLAKATLTYTQVPIENGVQKIEDSLLEDSKQNTVVSLLVDSKQSIEDSLLLSVKDSNVGGVGGKEKYGYLQTGVEMSGKVDLEEFFHDLVGDFTSTDANAVKFRALCPVHSEHTPSFWFNVSDGWFRCYGCGIEGLGMLELLDRMGIDGEELLDYAYAYSLDVEPDEERTAKIKARELQQIDRVGENKRKYANEIVQVRDWYAHGFGGANVVDTWIDGKQTPERDYLFERGILPTALQHFKAAVFLNIPHHRIYFPLALNGCVHGYQRRGIKESKHTPKYLTMTGMDKSVHVYGDVVGDTVLVCEGITDLLVGYQRGVTSIVTSLGAIVSDEQCYELFSLGIKHVIHAAHPDHAGDSAFLFGRMAFAKFGIESKRLILTTDIADSRRDDFLMAYEKVATSFQRV